MSDSEREAVLERRWEAGAVLAAVLAALLLRIVGAWLGANDPHPDHAAARLVSRHLAEGTHAPAFHYRQWHLGTLEPALGGLVMKVLGDSGYVANLAAVIPGCLLIPLVYLWAQAAGGRRAGLAALAFVAVGPPFFLEHTSRTYGGYAMLLFLGTLTLWMALAAVEGIRRGAPPSRLTFVLMGLAAGLGWWTSPLMLVFLAASALVWALGLGRGLCHRRLGYAFMGFVGGALPWWIRQRPPHVAFWREFHAFSGAAWWGDVRVFLSERLPSALGMWPGSAGRWLTVAAYALLLAAAAGLLARRRDGGWPHFGLPATAGWLLLVTCAAMTAGLSLLFLPAAREVLPCVPAAAVLVGLGASRLMRRWPRGLGWAPLLIVVLPHWLALREVGAHYAADKAVAGRSTELVRWMEARQVEGVLMPATGTGVSGTAAGATGVPGTGATGRFVLERGGHTAFGDPRAEYYRPTALRLERAANVAVLGDPRGVRDFLTGCGGMAREETVAGFDVACDFRPPEDWQEIDPGDWIAAFCEGNDARAPLTDADAGSGLSTGLPDQPRVIEIRFARPCVVSGFRLLAADETWPVAWEAAVEETQGGWRPVVDGPRPTTAYFWSGPRPCLGGRDYRLEGRFEACRSTALRLTFHPAPGTAVRPVELQCFRPPVDLPAAGNGSMSALLEFLRTRTIRRLYADRWLANRAVAMGGDSLAATVDRAAPADPASVLPAELTLSPWTAIVTEDENARLCRVALERVGLKLAEQSFGGWRVFHVSPGAWNDRYTTVSGLRWVGYAVLTAPVEDRP